MKQNNSGNVDIFRVKKIYKKMADPDRVLKK